jgi:hypothetical protein
MAKSKKPKKSDRLQQTVEFLRKALASDKQNDPGGMPRQRRSTAGPSSN